MTNTKFLGYLQRINKGSGLMARNNHHFEIKRFATSRNKNQYLLISRNEAAVIDVSESYEEIGKIIGELGINLKYLLITHAHKPHLQALPDFRNNHGGTFCLHEYEYELLQKTEGSLEPDRIVNDQDKLKVGDIEIEVLLTAGHTKG